MIAFLLSVCVRIPQLARPMSHHHESISAYELITIESWKQAGGPARFNDIPLSSYQQPGDKRIPNNYNIDKNGNEIYISYGTGWNLLPYYSFELLHIAPTPLALRLLNICIGLVACFRLFWLMVLVSGDDSKKYGSAAIACIAFLFTPGTLWYFSNVYVNCGVAIPFIIAFLYCLLQMILHPQAIRASNLILLFLLVICLLCIDWIGCFLAFTSTLVLLFKIKKNRRLAYPMMVIILGTIAGLGLIAWQFISYLGPSMVQGNLAYRFSNRTVHASQGFLHPFTATAVHFATASLPVIALLVIALLAGRRRKENLPPGNNALVLYVILLPALLLYNTSFLSWTSIHEFSILYYTILFAIGTGTLLPRVWPIKKTAIALMALITVTVVEYYLVNPPGSKTWNGEAHNVYRQLGDSIAKKAAPGQAVFMNLELLPPVEFYAKRNIMYAASPEEAKQLLSNFKTSEGIWIQQNGFHITRVAYIHKEGPTGKQ